MSTIAIRALGARDAEQVAEVSIAAWAPYFDYLREALGEDLFEAEHGDWAERKAAQVRSNARGEHGTRGVAAMAEGRLVGFVTFRIDGGRRVGEIGNNAVHPRWQGKGIATALYRRVLATMRNEGVISAKVRTGGDPAHAPARHTYEKVGFGMRIEHVEYHIDLRDTGG